MNIIDLDSLVTSSTSRRGMLTYMEKDRPYVYIQLLPDSDDHLDQINEVITKITEHVQPASTCNPGDLVVAKFSMDDTYYRARIESHSTTPGNYSVYFLDFGNIDENVSSDHILTYPDELKSIEAQAHRYLLDQIKPETWINIIRPALETDKLNDEVEFDIIDEQNSIIHMDIPHEEPVEVNEQVDTKEEPVEVNEHVETKEEPTEVNEQVETKEESAEVHEPVETNEEPAEINEPVEKNEELNNTLSGYISAVEKDCFYLQPSSNVTEMNDLLKTLTRENRPDGNWTIGDRCLVSNDDDHLYRGEIVGIAEQEYTVKCFDYGFILSNRNVNQLYLVPDEDIFRQEPLAHQCRLASLDDDQQWHVIDQIIRQIPSSEHVTIEIINERDASCWCVNLHREDQQLVNEQLQQKENEQSPGEVCDEKKRFVHLSVCLSVFSNSQIMIRKMRL